MAWIESHQKLKEHPKLLLLAQKMNWSIDETIGKLHRLWWWVLDYAEDGDISKYLPEQIAGAMGINGEAKKVYETLIETNFIESSGLIHDWLDYAGHYLHLKYHTSNPLKLKKIHKKYKVYLRSTFRRPLGPNNLNQPNQPKPTNTNTQSVSVFFSYFLLKTGKKLTLTPSRKAIIEARLKDHTTDELKKAVDNFVQDDWPDRHKFVDIVYCIGIRNRIDNLEKWLNWQPKGQSKPKEIWQTQSCRNCLYLKAEPHREGMPGRLCTETDKIQTANTGACNKFKKKGENYV